MGHPPPFNLVRILKHSDKKSLKTVSGIAILDAQGHRLVAKYYTPTTTKEQLALEAKLFEKTRKVPNGIYKDLIFKGDILMLDHALVLYKPCNDLFVYLIAHSPDENEIMLFSILNSFHDALTILLRYRVSLMIFIGMTEIK